MENKKEGYCFLIQIRHEFKKGYSSDSYRQELCCGQNKML